MSNADRIRVSMVLESTYGVTPATPTMEILPTTGQSLRPRVSYQQSRTIRNDRNVSDFIRVGKSAGGGLPCELTYSGGTEALKSALGSVLCQPANSPQSYGTCTTTASAKTITASMVDFTAAIEVGDIIRLSGATPPEDNGYFKVTAVATLTVTVERPTNFTGSVGNVTLLRGSRAKNGTLEQSYTIEIARLDLQKAQIFTGCVFDGVDFTIADEAITTANFSISAQSSSWVNAVSPDVFITGATYNSPAANPVLDSIGVPEVQSGGIDYAARSIQMSLRNNVAPRTQIGTLGAQSMRFGQFSATGRISAYLDSPDDLQRYENNTATDLWLVMIDPSGKGYSISFPQIKYTDAGADTTGPNQDDFKDLAVAAYLDPTEACTVRFQRWD
jgi:Phage tail tube protein